MTQLALSVPPGFVISIDAYKRWRGTGLLPDEDIKGTSLSIATDRYDNRPKGFGFLEIPTKSEAKAAISY